MKQQTNFQKKTKSQIQINSGQQRKGKNKTTTLLKPTTSMSNTFLVQNIGKDPPGRSCSPAAACCLEPDNPPATLKNNIILLITEFQMFKQIQNPNFYNN